jgi:hypothetical protein
VLILVCGIIGQAEAQIGGQPGAFSRMGFGARGLAMGNALSAVTQGELVGYYNPAILPRAQHRTAQASFGFLSLDRSLNFLSYSQAVDPVGGISAGIINAGVSDIDGRDSDGEPTGPLRTSENQVALGFGVRFTDELSAGVNLKLFYYRLYTDVSSTTVGVDLGVLYRISPDLHVGAVARDLSSKYKWDTNMLLGQSGEVSEDLFPQLYIGAVSYMFPDSLALLAAEVEFSTVSTLFMRAGAEIPILPEFVLRAGVDRVDLKDEGNGIRPSFGFMVQKIIGTVTPALNYSFVLEPFSPSGIHMVSLTAQF